jgi:hypothetical protein
MLTSLVVVQYMFVCVDGGGGGGGVGGLSKGAKIGRFFPSMGLAKGRSVASSHKRAKIPSNRVIFAYKHHTSIKKHSCACYIICLKIHILSPLQVQNKPRDGQPEHVFILGPLNCMVANSAIAPLRSHHYK